MKIRRSIVVLFVIAAFVVPISLYRSMVSADASAELLSTVGVVYKLLMGIFLLLVVAFSIFTDDFPHTYGSHASRFLGFVTILLAALVGYASALGLISEDFAAFSGMPGKIFSVLGILSVLSFMFYSVTYFKGENVIASMALIPVFPAIWYGYRMLLCFLRSASMADISRELPVIAMCCSFTILLLTLGKLFSCIHSNSIKWGFAAGCIGVLTALVYVSDWLANDCGGLSDALSNPLVFCDFLMALFAVGSMFHVSSPAEYFDDEEWDDYFYETYDLPKPNLVLHTPVDELEEDSLMDDDLDDDSYIPVTSAVGGRGRAAAVQQTPPPTPPAPLPAPLPAQVPSYIANPAAYYPQGYPPAYYPQAYPGYPAYPAYPTYPYPSAPGIPGYDYYPQAPVPSGYANPYDAAAAEYQYERRRSELQSRELEKLTGEVDSSLARLQSNVAQNQPPANEYVAASPDEKIGGRFTPAQTGRNIHLAQGYVQSGERITDHLDRMERESREREQQDYDAAGDEYEDYTYEYYYPTDGRSRYDLTQFGPNAGNGGNSGNRR